MAVYAQGWQPLLIRMNARQAQAEHQVRPGCASSSQPSCGRLAMFLLYKHFYSHKPGCFRGTKKLGYNLIYISLGLSDRHLGQNY